MSSASATNSRSANPNAPVSHQALTIGSTLCGRLRVGTNTSSSGIMSPPPDRRVRDRVQALDGLVPTPAEFLQARHLAPDRPERPPALRDQMPADPSALGWPHVEARVLNHHVAAGRDESRPQVDLALDMCHVVVRVETHHDSLAILEVPHHLADQPGVGRRPAGKPLDVRDVVAVLLARLAARPRVGVDRDDLEPVLLKPQGRAATPGAGFDHDIRLAGLDQIHVAFEVLPRLLNLDLAEIVVEVAVLERRPGRFGVPGGKGSQFSFHWADTPGRRRTRHYHIWRTGGAQSLPTRLLASPDAHAGLYPNCRLPAPQPPA